MTGCAASRPRGRPPTSGTLVTRGLPPASPRGCTAERGGQRPRRRRSIPPLPLSGGTPRAPSVPVRCGPWRAAPPLPPPDRRVVELLPARLHRAQPPLHANSPFDNGERASQPRRLSPFAVPTGAATPPPKRTRRRGSTRKIRCPTKRSVWFPGRERTCVGNTRRLPAAQRPPRPPRRFVRVARTTAGGQRATPRSRRRGKTCVAALAARSSTLRRAARQRRPHRCRPVPGEGVASACRTRDGHTRAR